MPVQSNLKKSSSKLFYDKTYFSVLSKLVNNKAKTFQLIIDIKSIQTFSKRSLTKPSLAFLAFSQAVSFFSLSDNIVFCFSMVSNKRPVLGLLINQHLVKFLKKKRKKNNSLNFHKEELLYTIYYSPLEEVSKDFKFWIKTVPAEFTV